jgi:actin-related protein 10
MDTRRSMAENIVIIGGTPMLPGFKHRLMNELLDMVSTVKYKSELGNLTFKFHSPPAKENYVAWLGGVLNNFRV